MTYRILMLEPEPTVRKTLRSALLDPDYELQESAADSTALARVREYRPHVVVSEMALAGGVISFLRSVEALPEPPAVILVVDPQSRMDAAQALRAGAHDYILKPILPQEVSARVRRAVDHRRAFEEVKLQLVQAGTMASLGRLVAGVAHELNTPVGAINSNSDVMTRVLKKLQAAVDGSANGERKGEILESLHVLSDLAEVDRIACERITDAVRNLKSFARLDESDRKVVDIHEGLDSTVRLVENFRNRIRIEKDYGKVPMIECHPHQLNQVFMNLLANAADAIEGKGVIRIRTRYNGQDAIIEISDSGKGIAPDDLSKIFQPGFTTKGVGVGMGLGLSLAYRIIQAHAGTITAKSALGEGTTFTVTLPIPDSQAR